MTDRLNRNLAPISERAWPLIDAEARRSLAHYFAGRSVVDFTGPLGWDFSAQPTGRTDPSTWPVEGVEVRTRRVAALSEVRVQFTLDRDEIDAVERGSTSPYVIALGDRCYTGVIETTEHGGYPVFEHLRAILGGRVVWAPSLDGAIVVSVRGGDFEMICGGDFAVGFAAATARSVELYLEESFAFVVHEAKAAVALVYP